MFRLQRQEHLRLLRPCRAQTLRGGAASIAAGRLGRCRFGRRRAFELRELPLGQQATLLIAVHGFEDRLDLELPALHALEVGFDLGRQLAGILPAVLFTLLFGLDQPPLGLLELRLQKRVGARHEHFAIPHALFHEQRGQPLRDLHDRPWILAHEAHLKRVTLHDRSR